MMRLPGHMSDEFLALVPTVVFVRRKVGGLGSLFGEDGAVEHPFGGCIWVKPVQQLRLGTFG